MPDREKHRAKEEFYSESNMKYLEKVISDIDEGRAKLAEHDLIEADYAAKQTELFAGNSDLFFAHLIC